MTEEIFDIVNEADEPIGAASRSVVHRAGFRHRAVHVLVFNSKGEVFLQKRSMSKDSAPGKWDSSASGHLDRGEDYDACAIRELAEELSFSPAEPPERLFKLPASSDTDNEFVWVYRCRGEGPFVLHPEEIDSGSWLSLGEISRLILERPDDYARSFRLVWKSYSAAFQ